VATAGVPAIHENADRGPATSLLPVAAAAVCAGSRRSPGRHRGRVARHRHRYRPRRDRYLDQGLPEPARTQPGEAGHQLAALRAARRRRGGPAQPALFQAGPLAASLPAITVVNPLLTVLLGVMVYDENLRHTPWAITTEAGFLVLFTAAAFALTRHQAAAAEPPLPGHPHAHQG
jgi:hypothetical protein